jgi:hypothetical protein
MTDFNAHGYRLYDFGFKDGDPGTARIESSDNFLELLEDVYNDVRIIVNNKRVVPEDSAFFLVPAPEAGEPRKKPSFVYLDLDVFVKPYAIVSRLFGNRSGVSSIEETLKQIRFALREPGICDEGTQAKNLLLIRSWQTAVTQALERRGPPMPEYQEIKAEVEARTDFAMKREGRSINNNS